MVKFVDTDFSALIPGLSFTIKWDYESPSTSEETRARGVSINFKLRPFGDAKSHDIWLGDSQGNGIPGTSYNWEVPLNIPLPSAVATLIISEVSRTFEGITASTTAFVITNTPSATGLLAAASLPYCTDDSATNCINAPSSATFVASTTISSIADPVSHTPTVLTITPSTLFTSTTPRITSTATPAPTSFSTSTDQDSPPHALTPGAKAGIAIGAVFAVFIFAVVGFFFYKYSKRRALQKDWTASGGVKPDTSADPLQKAGEGDDFRKAELDATPTPAPAYIERFAGSGGGEGDGSYVHPEEGFFRAELAGNSEFGIEPAPMAKHEGELEDTSAKKTTRGIAEKTDDKGDEKKIAASGGEKPSEDPNGIGEAVSTDP